MPNTFTSNVFSSTYKDDFLDSDNYHRILFNSGRALQARELTQMQTIIQEEIARFGRNIFRDGAAVNPGGPSINNEYEFVKLDTTDSANALPTDLTTIVGVELTGGTSTVKARVLEAVNATATDPATIYVQYTNTSGGSVGTTPVRFNPTETLTGGGFTLKVQTTDTVDNPSTGLGAKVHNDGGDFFVRGHFVFVKPQGLILSKYSNNPTKTIGFKITEDIVTATDDDALYDNQGATPNVTSPGADRYRIQLVLTTKDAIVSGENFVFYCQVTDGEVVDQVSGTDDYNKINDLLAERTKEESGNYFAERFKADLADSGTNHLLGVSRGIAYVNGYRAESQTPVTLTIAKPRTTTTINNDVAPISYGSYFICSTLKGSLNVSEFASVNLSTHASDPSGSVVGTAKVRYVEEDGSNHKVYLFDIKMNSGIRLSSIKTIGTGSVDVGIILLENSKAVLKEASKTNLVYPLTQTRPSNITDVSFEVQRIKTGTTSGTGTLTIAGLGSGETYTNTGQVIATVDSSGEVVTPSSITGGSSLVFAGLPHSSAMTFYTKVNKSTPSVRQKTLSSTITYSAAVESDGTGTSFVNLHATDLQKVSAIYNADSADLSARFSIDNGQRASHYANARLIVQDGATPPSGDVFVKYKHWTHGAGDFFSVNSYDGLASGVEYEGIPNYSINSRSSVNLRDVIDFRSSVDSDGTFTGAGAALNEIPTNGDTFQGDITYYLPRKDKVVITTDGTIKNIQGEPGFQSQIPPTPENTLGLFNLSHNGYGLHDSDTVVRPLEAKRFTMRDISKLEKRIDKLEEVTSLSLLEVDTNAMLVLDSAGNPRSKSGFFVDNFKDRAFVDVQNSEHRAGIDPTLGFMSPQQTSDNIKLKYDSDLSTNTILKGDTVYIKHTSTPSIEQIKVSGTENVNPFAVITGIGTLTLSPSSDEWQNETVPVLPVINTNANMPVAIDGSFTFGMNGGMNWSANNFIPLTGYGPIVRNYFNGFNGTQIWNSLGTDAYGASHNGQTGNLNGRPNHVAGLFVPSNTAKSPDSLTDDYSREITNSFNTIKEVVGERTVSLTFIPFIRARKIFFRAEGLIPNTRYFPFFDGVAMDDFVREETFARFSTTTSGGVEYGKEFRNSTSHPQGTSTLVTDGNGKIEGSFFIPCQEGENGIKFKTGAREFKLLDISSDNNNLATSIATFNYLANGALPTKQSTRASCIAPTIKGRRRDPVAQSFRILEPTGIFVTKVECFFKTKDASLPVEMQIRPMVNGAPSSTEIVANASTFVLPASVALPAGQTSAQVLEAPTIFQFDEPIFLSPDVEYAIVLLAGTTDYNVYVAETYQFELGSTEAKVSRQPAQGSFFKSSNGSTWEPDQTKDLMFRIYKAVFDTSGGSAVFENTDIQNDLLINNGFYGDSGDATVTTLLPNHGFSVNDKVNIAGLTAGTRYNGILGSSINGENTVTAVDGFGFTFEADSASTSAGVFGGATVKVDKQINFDGVIPNFSTLIPDETSVSFGAKFTTGKSLAGGETKYQKDTAYTNDISVGEENYFIKPKLIANLTNETAQLGSGVRSTTWKVDLSTTRADVSPIVDTQRVSLITLSNMIDNQVASSPTAGEENVPLNYVAETTAFGGSSLAKHITSVQVLAETAVGLKVIVGALRPKGSNFDLYFRTANDGEDILEKTWTLQTQEQSIPADNRNFREYRFLIGGQGGDVAEFTQYQYKIVMRSNNSSAVPLFRDFRSIAMAV